MSKGGSSETRTEIPAWLSGALKPLLTQSTRNAQQFGAQGANVLQGLDPNTGQPGTAVPGSGLSMLDLARGAGKIKAPSNRGA